MAIDIIDEKLLEVLQENSRISISELSKKINLSLSAVSERLKKLETSGIIEQYTAILNSAEMNKNIDAVIWISVDNVGNADFEKLINSEKDILYCARIAGEYDYILRVFTKDQKSLRVIIDKIKNLRTVRNVITSVVLDNIKLKYSVPPIATK